MPEKIHWNKWGFVPSLACLSAAVILLAVMSQTPRWPLHFGGNGIPNRFGDSRELWGMVVFQVFLMVAMAFLDEGMLSVRKWYFNIAGAIAAFVSGIFLMAITLSFYSGAEGRQVVHMTWWILGAGTLPAGLAYGLEALRHYPETPPEVIKTAPIPAIPGGNWCYWEHFNPWWFNGLLGMVGLGIPFTGIMNATHFKPWWAVLVQLLVVALVIIPMGGIYLSLNREKLSIQFGWLKIPCLALKVADIRSVELVEINPLKQFGGWGIRYGLGCGWGFILGNRGIKLVTARGRRITISMKNPEAVASLLQPPVKDQV